MQKFVWIIFGVCFFLCITALAISTENLNYGKRVNFVNVNLALRNSGNRVITQNVTTSDNVITENTSYTTTTSGNKNTSTVTSRTEYSTSPVYTKESYERKYSTDKTSLNYKNIDDDGLDKILKENKKTQSRKVEYGEPVAKYKKTKEVSQTPGYPSDEYEYGYNDIDWSRWKSNFVNKILDDSISISELDKYPNGAFFYYSFIVDYEGRISDVSVRSMYLSEQDKQLVSNFIKGYAHKPITRFPAKTNRKTARVSAIMMLSNAETIHSKPSDFNDTERIKYQIKR